MLNQVIVVGRICQEPELKITKSGKRLCFVTLASKRTFRNSVSGEYDTDFISVTLWEKIASNVTTYCKKGDIIGIKGRLAVIVEESEDNVKTSHLEVIAENVSFISKVSEKGTTEDEIEIGFNIEDQVEF